MFSSIHWMQVTIKNLPAFILITTSCIASRVMAVSSPGIFQNWGKTRLMTFNFFITGQSSLVEGVSEGAEMRISSDRFFPPPHLAQRGLLQPLNVQMLLPTISKQVLAPMSYLGTFFSGPGSCRSPPLMADARPCGHLLWMRQTIRPAFESFHCCRLSHVWKADVACPQLCGPL